MTKNFKSLELDGNKARDWIGRRLVTSTLNPVECGKGQRNVDVFFRGTKVTGERTKN